MICNQCGTDNNENSEICSKCGSRIITKNQDLNSTATTEMSTIDQETKEKINRLIKKLTLTIIILLITAGVCEVISLYIEAVAFPFALFGLLVLIATMVLAIIRIKQNKKLKPPKQKKSKQSD